MFSPSERDVRTPRTIAREDSFSGGSRCNEFLSRPEPPDERLWDVVDVHYLDKVRCKATVTLTSVDPRNGAFEGRLMMQWSLRTLNLHDRTEPRVRVPGVRAPKLIMDTSESRIWRKIIDDSDKSMCWEGITVLNFDGFESFEVHQFPYDRQVINLGIFEFVWRSTPDQQTYDETMKVVWLEIESKCMLQEWQTFPAIVEPKSELVAADGPSFCANFEIKLRMQRRARFYLTQIFMVTFLIMVAALLPLGMDPMSVGDRLALHSGGLLTLVAFKYGVQHDLPVVPYSTFTSTFLTRQIVTLVLASIESLISFKIASAHERSFGDSTWDATRLRHARVEETILVIVLSVWTAYLIYCMIGKQRDPWEKVLNSQVQSAHASQLEDPWGHGGMTNIFPTQFIQSVSNATRRRLRRGAASPSSSTTPSSQASRPHPAAGDGSRNGVRPDASEPGRMPL